MTNTYMMDFYDLDLLESRGFTFNPHWDELNEKTLMIPVDMTAEDYERFMNDEEEEEEE